MDKLLATHEISRSDGMPNIVQARRRPGEVTAVQSTRTTKIPLSGGGHSMAHAGDWIVTGKSGKIWVCEEEDFPLLYEVIS